MDYVCDAPNDETWFRIVTEAEAMAEATEMSHAVDKHFRREWDRAAESFRSNNPVFIEQDIGKRDHIKRAMPLFLTLRDQDGRGLVTAMVTQPGPGSCVVVGRANADPYPDHAAAIAALGRHLGQTLDRARCYPYRR